MKSDLFFVLRSLWRERVFTLLVVVTLALGIGVSAAVFSMVDRILFRPAGMPKDLASIAVKANEAEPMDILWHPFLESFERETTVVQEIAASASQFGNVVVSTDPVEARYVGITPNFFSMLGVTPVLGRAFTLEEATAGKDKVVIISDLFWRKHFSADPNVLGKTIRLNGEACTVVGVLARNQTVPLHAAANVYRPFVRVSNAAQPWDPMLYMIVRLHPGVPNSDAAAALSRARPSLNPQFNWWLERMSVVLRPLREETKAFRPEVYWMMLGAVFLLYVVSCLNVTNLLVLRALGRRRELSTRLALGATKSQLARLVALENGILGIGAAAGGILVANWLFPLLLYMANRESTWTPDWSLDWRTLGILGVLAVVSVVLVTAVPLVRLRSRNLTIGLKEGGTAVGESRRLAALRGIFSLLQTAVAVVLLTGAGLMMRTFENLMEVGISRNQEQLAKIQIMFPRGFLEGNEERLEFLKRAEDELRRFPGVVGAAMGTDVFVPGFTFAASYFRNASGEKVPSENQYVTAGIAELNSPRLLRGRWMDPSTQQEVVISANLAAGMFGQADPIGQLLKPDGADANWKGWTVVGVVEDLRSTVREAAPNRAYLAAEKMPNTIHYMFLRFAGNVPPNLESSVKKTLYQFDSRLVVMNVKSVPQWRGMWLWTERFAMDVFKVLASVACILATVGLFSVVAYAVSRRMNEFGVRMALGATPAAVRNLVLKRGLLLALGGVAIGLASTVYLARFLRGLLFGISAHEPAILVAVSLGLLATAAIACVIPAIRAARANPATLLKAE